MSCESHSSKGVGKTQEKEKPAALRFDSARFLSDLLEGDFSFCTREGVVFGQEEHAMALLPFLHGYAGAVPVGRFNFGLFIFVVTAGA